MRQPISGIKPHKGWIVLGFLMISVLVVACGRSNDATGDSASPTTDSVISTETPSSITATPVPTSTPIPATDTPVPTDTPTKEPSFSERLLIGLGNMPVDCRFRTFEKELPCGIDKVPFLTTDPADAACLFSNWFGSTESPSELTTVVGAEFDAVESVASETPSKAWLIGFEFSSYEAVSAYLDVLKGDNVWPIYQSDNSLIIAGGDYYPDENRCYSSLQNLIMAEGATMISPRIELLGFDYTLQDKGDGWNEGSLRFAIESSSPFPLYLDSLDFTRGGAVLETLEGPTYPVSIRRADGMKGYFAIIEGPIPPGFAIRGVGGGIDAGQPDLVLTWRSAAAATPARIVFPDYPDLELEIPPVQNLGYSTPYSSVSISTISDAQGFKLIDNPQGLQVILNGNCFPTEPLMGTQTFILAATFKNNDMFQEVNIQNDLQAMQVSVLNKDTGNQSHQKFTRSYDMSGDSLFRLGPGQSAEGLLAIEDQTRHGFGANSIIVFWLPDGSFRIYDPSQCLPGGK